MSDRIDRRRFLTGSGVAAAGALLAGAPAIARAAGTAKPGSTTAATVIKNGRVWTGKGTIADAVAIGGNGKIMAVGTNNDMTSLVGSKTVVLSAAGGTVISGIHDGHIHPRAVVPYLIYPWLEDAQLTVAELTSALNGYLADAATVYAGDWLNVLGWNPVACPIDAPANKSILDGLANNQTARHPIILRGSDGHNSWVNSIALQLAGITASTPNPTGGEIKRDASGEPTGVLVDSAQELVMKLIPVATPQEQLPYMEWISGYMATNGITSLQDAACDPDGLELYKLASQEGALLQRVQAALWLPQELFGSPKEALAWATNLKRQYAGVPWLTVRTIKIFLDGVMEFPAQTAAMLDPYLDANGVPTTNYGNLYVENPTLAKLVTTLDKNGWQVHLHAIGDRAVRTGLDAFEAARKANGPTQNRHVMAHLQLVHPTDYARFGTLGVIPDFQLQWACSDYWTGPALEPYIGAERHGRLYPAKSVLAGGGALAGGSDWPVDPLYPWNQVATAIDRIGLGGLPQTGAGGTGQPLDPDQALSLSDSLNMHTKGSAFQLHQEAATGTIEVGKDADLQILDLDVTTATTAKIALATVLRTMRAGVTTYDATAPSSMTTPAKASKVKEAAARASRQQTGCACTHPA
jgi:predicted amidohydrolase YtcJ